MGCTTCASVAFFLISRSCPAPFFLSLNTAQLYHGIHKTYGHPPNARAWSGAAVVRARPRESGGEKKIQRERKRERGRERERGKERDGERQKRDCVPNIGMLGFCPPPLGSWTSLTALLFVGHVRGGGVSIFSPKKILLCVSYPSRLRQGWALAGSGPLPLCCCCHFRMNERLWVPAIVYQLSLALPMQYADLPSFLSPCNTWLRRVVATTGQTTLYRHAAQDRRRV